MGCCIFSWLFLFSFALAVFTWEASACPDKISGPIDLTNYQALIGRVEAEAYVPPKLLCDFAKHKSYPDVLLIGERHWGSDSSQKVKKAVMEKAVAGQTHLLIEVIPDTGTPNGEAATYPWTAKNPEFLSPRYISPNIEGIESFIPKAIMEASAIDGNLEEEIKNGKTLSLKSAAIGINVSNNPVFKAALNRINRRNSTSCRQCGSLFKTVSENEKFNDKTRYTYEWMVKIDQEIKKIPPQEYFSFVRELFQEVINLVAPEIKRRFPELNVTKQKFSEAEINKITINWRDEDFALTIASWLCANANSAKKLTVIVGDNHSQGVMSNLKKLTKDMPKIKYQKSFDENAANSIVNE